MQKELSPTQFDETDNICQEASMQTLRCHALNEASMQTLPRYVPGCGDFYYPLAFLLMTIFFWSAFVIHVIVSGKMQETCFSCVRISNLAEGALTSESYS